MFGTAPFHDLLLPTQQVSVLSVHCPSLCDIFEVAGDDPLDLLQALFVGLVVLRNLPKEQLLVSEVVVDAWELVSLQYHLPDEVQQFGLYLLAQILRKYNFSAFVFQLHCEKYVFSGKLWVALPLQDFGVGKVLSLFKPSEEFQIALQGIVDQLTQLVGHNGVDGSEEHTNFLLVLGEGLQFLPDVVYDILNPFVSEAVPNLSDLFLLLFYEVQQVYWLAAFFVEAEKQEVLVLPPFLRYLEDTLRQQEQVVSHLFSRLRSQSD